MLSNVNPALSSPRQHELPPPNAHPPLSAVRAPRGSSKHITAPDGYDSPDRIGKRIAPSQHQQLQQRQHGFNPPRPSLSPLSEYHSGFSDADVGSAYSPANTHRRQHSFPNLLPLPFRSRTPSPTRKAPRLPEPMPYTGDGRSGPKVDNPKTGGLAGWFSGTAASSMLGMSQAQEEDGTPDATPTRPRRSATNASMTNPATPKNTAASRFMSAISSKFASTPTSPIIDDEICNLNIETALFPPNSPTSPSDRDSFSPAAFKNFQMNAIGLLTKMQNAYRDRVATLKELQNEKLAQREEVEEAETRARHLKMQLEGMARKAQEQEKEMQLLMEELAAERKARAEERLAAEKFLSEGSMVAEDLGVDEERRRRKWVRKSGDTVKSEAGFDTDEESAESESVFSRCRSPTLTISGALDSGSVMESTVSVPSQRGSLAPPSTRLRIQQQQQPQMSAFQKIIKGIAGEAEETSGCSNCKGRDASVAWDTVSLLRDENKHLKQRVGQLEVAVEGALDLVNGIGL